MRFYAYPPINTSRGFVCTTAYSDPRIQRKTFRPQRRPYGPPKLTRKLDTDEKIAGFFPRDFRGLVVREAYSTSCRSTLHLVGSFFAPRMIPCLFHDTRVFIKLHDSAASTQTLHATPRRRDSSETSIGACGTRVTTILCTFLEASALCRCAKVATSRDHARHFQVAS